MKKIKLNRHKGKSCLWAFVDNEDYEKVNKYRWFITTVGYVETLMGGKKQYLHRFLLNFPSQIVDHINQNKLDNRKINLRLANKRINAFNSKIRCDNKTGRKGVCFSGGKYIATIWLNGKQIYLGSSYSYDKAVVLRERGELLYV